MGHPERRTTTEHGEPVPVLAFLSFARAMVRAACQASPLCEANEGSVYGAGLPLRRTHTDARLCVRLYVGIYSLVELSATRASLEDDRSEHQFATGMTRDLGEGVCSKL